MVELRTLAAVFFAFLLATHLPISASKAENNISAEFSQGLASFDGGDYKTAMEHWLPLAKTGFADAQIGVALIYDQGLGRKQDPQAAMHWYNKAAIQGEAIAQIAIAERHESGLGPGRDLALALAWYGVAARSGNIYAQQARDRLSVIVPEDAQIKASDKIKLLFN